MLQESLPTRGAWIEIKLTMPTRRMLWSLPTRGAWIEITPSSLRRSSPRSRSPHGERGLKYDKREFDSLEEWSLPTRGAWIEIMPCTSSIPVLQSLPTRGAWIEMKTRWRRLPRTSSLPTRGAWIEMSSVILGKSACPNSFVPCGFLLTMHRRGVAMMVPASLHSGDEVMR